MRVDPFTADDVAIMLAETHWEECEACEGTGVDDTVQGGQACQCCEGEGIVWIESDDL